MKQDKEQSISDIQDALLAEQKALSTKRTLEVTKVSLSPLDRSKIAVEMGDEKGYSFIEYIFPIEMAADFVVGAQVEMGVLKVISPMEQARRAELDAMVEEAKANYYRERERQFNQYAHVQPALGQDQAGIAVIVPKGLTYEGKTLAEAAAEAMKNLSHDNAVIVETPAGDQIYISDRFPDQVKKAMELTQAEREQAQELLESHGSSVVLPERLENQVRFMESHGIQVDREEILRQHEANKKYWAERQNDVPEWPYDAKFPGPEGTR